MFISSDILETNDLLWKKQENGWSIFFTIVAVGIRNCYTEQSSQHFVTLLVVVSFPRESLICH